MKEHAIIPVFIPHLGCPHTCVFCNQNMITARQPLVRVKDVETIIETYLPTLEGRGLKTIEVAFFGGSFTGIPLELQRDYLSVAKKYKDLRLIDKIHISTRPDYINDQILELLKQYGVDVIELGVQSFDEEVLKLSERGHDAGVVYESSRKIKEYGFELGIQLMIGLPGDSFEKDLFSARELVRIGPSIARLYPTVVIEGTGLYDLYREGRYQPLSTDEAVRITKEMYKVIQKAGINIIRVGLKSTELIKSNADDVAGDSADGSHGSVAGNSFHPAFRQLVEGEIAKEELEAQLIEHLQKYPDRIRSRIRMLSNEKSFSNMIGNRKVNKEYFQNKYPALSIEYGIDKDLEDYCYRISDLAEPS